MNFWVVFWGLTLALVLIAYAGLFFWVAAGGLSDIRSMLNALKRQGPDLDDDSL